MQFSVLLLLSASANVAFTKTVEDIWTFPVGTWVENLSVRSNGQIVVTTLNKPQIFQVDPSKREPAHLVAEIPSKLSVVGISELGHDMFYVNAGNFSIATGTEGLGTSSVYELDLRNYQAGGPLVTPRLVADLPHAGLLNGNTVLDEETRTLLLADSVKGAAWWLNVTSGETQKVVTNQLMAPVSKTNPLGINGLKVFDNELYWTNTDQNLIAKASINCLGVQSGAARVLVANITTVDDLFITGKDRGLVAGNDEMRSFESTTFVVVSEAKLVEGSTAVQPGPAKGSYYITTSGGAAQYFSKNVTVPGKVVKIFL